jgi:hypothetical protein
LQHKWCSRFFDHKCPGWNVLFRQRFSHDGCSRQRLPVTVGSSVTSLRGFSGVTLQSPIKPANYISWSRRDLVGLAVDISPEEVAPTDLFPTIYRETSNQQHE